MIDGFITTGDGCRIAWNLTGPEAGPPLVLSNSLGTDMTMWDPQMPELSSRFRVLRYDSRGHGRSAAPAGAYSLDRLGRDVIELMDALDLGIVAFCGLSLGGMVGQWLGVRAPERLRRLVIANSSAYMGPPANWDARIALALREGMAPLADASLARWFTPGFPEREPTQVEPIRRGLLATDPVGYAGCCAAIRDMDMRRTNPLNGTETLVIGGTLDPATPPADSQALVGALPHARLAMLEAAHLSNVEQPDAFTAHILGFLAG